MRSSRRLPSIVWAAILAMLCFVTAARVHAQDWLGEGGLGVVVLDETGQPIPGAAVVLVPEFGSPDQAPPFVFTDAGGRIEVQNLADGEWAVEIRAAGYMIFNGYLKLVAGESPELGFSSRQRTGTFWAPLEVRFFQPGVERPVMVAATPEARTLEQKREKEARQLAKQDAKAATRAEKRRQRRAAQGAEVAVLQPSEGEKKEAAPPPEEASGTRIAEAKPPETPAPTAQATPAPARPTPQPSARAPEPRVPPEERPSAVPPAAPAPEPSTRPAPSPPSAREPAPAPVEEKPPTSPPAPATPPATPPPAPVAEPKAETAPEPAVPSATAAPLFPPVREEPAPEPEPEPVRVAEAVAPDLPRPAPSAPAPSPDRGVPPISARPVLLRGGACPECKPGEWALVIERSAAPADGSASGCGSDRPAKVAELIADGLSVDDGLASFAGPAADMWGSGLPAPVWSALAGTPAASLRDEAGACQDLVGVLPAGARFIGFRYEVEDSSGRGDCFGDQPCPIGRARWTENPRIERTASVTVVHTSFLNEATDVERRARMTLYFRPLRDWQPPAAVPSRSAPNRR